MRKNVASQVVGVQMVSATDGSAFTGAVTVAVTGDGGTQATGSVGAGACTHEGNGFHTYAPAQAETNYNHVAFTFTGTGAVPATVQVYTVSFDPHDTVRLGLTALPNAAASAAGGLLDKLLGYLQLLSRKDAGIATDRATELAELNADEGSGPGAFDNTADPAVDVASISGDGTAADRLEAMLDGTGGVDLDLANVTLTAGLTITQSTADTPGVSITGNGTAAGLRAEGGTTGHGAYFIGGGASGDGLHCHSGTTAGNGATFEAHVATNGHGLQLAGVGSGAGLSANTITATGAITAATNAVPWNPDWDTEVESEANDALVALHLDHLLAADYDPAAKPGVATALLNELIGSDAGVSQFTANALELAPTGGGGGGDATLANQTTIITHLTDIKGATFAGATDSLEAIRNRGDTAWVTATGFSTFDATTDAVTVGTNNDKTGYGLASSGLDAVLVESGITAGATLTDDAGTQLTSINARQALAITISSLGAVLAGAATTNVTIKPAGKAAGNTRVDATVDSSGNRTAVTLKVPT